MPARPNILFLLSDEHSHRFLSARSTADGGEPCHTPTLDGLIAQGAHFSTAYCQMPLCTPSRIAMLCGRHAHRSGAWSNNSILPPELPTFASHLGHAGYATCTVGKMHLGGSRQFGGFEHRPYGDFGGPCAHQFDPLRTYRMGEALPGMYLRPEQVLPLILCRKQDKLNWHVLRLWSWENSEFVLISSIQIVFTIPDFGLRKFLNVPQNVMT